MRNSATKIGELGDLTVNLRARSGDRREQRVTRTYEPVKHIRQNECVA